MCCAITFGLFCATGVLIDQFINTQELEDCLVWAAIIAACSSRG